MLKKLYLQNFRNYTEGEIAFSPGVNWFTGENAQGKTNLLEAIYLLSCGRSFRTSQLSQLIQRGARAFYLEAVFEKDGVDQSLKLFFDGESKRVQINATAYSHFTPLIGLLPMVLYAPEDVSLVGGAPSHRRKFLDLHLAQVDPLYLHHLARFHRALKQRNELLKKHIEEAIEPWEEMIAQSSSYLMSKRQLLINSLEHPLKEMLLAVSSNSDHLKLEYEPSLPCLNSEEIVLVLKKNRRKELHVGTTLYGPHRDDAIFLIDELGAKAFASVGQKHSIIAALRLCIWEHLKEQTGEMPFFGIDDFGAHLDRTRQHNFEEKLQNLGQIFLTSPSASREIFPDKNILEIASGEIFHVSCS